MKINKKSFAISLATALVVSAFGYGVAFGYGGAVSVSYIAPQTTTTSQTQTSTLSAQAQLNALIAQLNAIMAQLKLQGGNPVPNLPNTGIGTFNRNLTVGFTGEDVLRLQQYLNTHGFIVADSGPGSPGNETTMFGGLTRAALKKFQSSKGITPAVGYFGPITRAQMI
jgi:peptidoglycan hydrolase-like protein with peptidoglycan-binding domain